MINIRHVNILQTNGEMATACSSYQIRESAGYPCAAGNAGNDLPATDFKGILVSDHSMHHGTWVMYVP